jgi:hypothetical protein
MVTSADRGGPNPRKGSSAFKPAAGQSGTHRLCDSGACRHDQRDWQQWHDFITHSGALVVCVRKIEMRSSDCVAAILPI